MTKTHTRVFDDYLAADSVVQALKTAGLAESRIAVVASNADGWHKPGNSAVDPKHDKDRNGSDDRSEGAVTGGSIGAVAGGALGVAAGLGLLAIPGIGPVVAMGWLATLAAGAVSGGAAGGIIGALVESGTSKENAELYAEALRRGGTIVTVKVPDDEEQKYAAILDRSAVNMTERAAAYRAEGWSGYDPSAPIYDAEHVRRERDTYRL
jgi:hypothetical protein